VESEVRLRNEALLASGLWRRRWVGLVRVVACCVLCVGLKRRGWAGRWAWRGGVERGVEGWIA
jgi:hypothetical protein